MAEGARLESVYTATYRGFESPPHRHIRDESLYASTGSFLLYSPLGGMGPPGKTNPELILLHPLILFAEVVHQRPDGGQQPAPRGKYRMDHFPPRLPLIQNHL